MQPAGIIFDFDGVIIDSMAFHLLAWQEAYRKLFDTSLDEKTLNSLIGRSTRQISRLLSKKAGYPEKNQQIAKTKNEYLTKNRSNVPLLPGVVEIIPILKKENIPYGIASNAPTKFILSVLEQHNLEFPVCMGIEMFPNPKPAPDPFLLCAKKLGIPIGLHRHIYVLEDSSHGIKAAKQAKMIPIGITTHLDAKKLREAGAKEVCNNIKSLIELGWIQQVPLDIQEKL